MNPDAASAVSPNPPAFPRKARLNADKQVDPHRTPVQICMPQHTLSGEPVSPQPAADTKVDESGCKTYAELIRTALLSSEMHGMELCELYDWFRQNTRRANNGTEGWKNSVRSNLSLNEAFQRLDGKGSYWRLVGRDLKPTRKTRASRRKKDQVPIRGRNSMAPPTPVYASKSNMPEIRHGHNSPWSPDDSTSPEKSQLQDDDSFRYSTPGLIAATQDGLECYMHDLLSAWNSDSRRYVNWPYCSCFLATLATTGMGSSPHLGTSAHWTT